MKTGCIVRADLSGLGFQTRAIAQLLNPDKILLIDSTPFNDREQHYEWYKDPIISMGFPDDALVESFLEGLDAVISCEVPYNNNLYKIARRLGVKTILQPNAELNPHFVSKHIDKPDFFFLPSSWYEHEYQQLRVPYFIIKPPIVQPRKKIQIKKDVGTLKVLHFGGRKAAFDRNGTELVQNLPEIEGVTIDIHDQSENEIVDQRELYETGHQIILIPRRYGGLCLPMLEGLSYGLPVLMPNISPNTDELPKDWLLKALNPRRVMTKRPIVIFETSVRDMVEHLKKWRDMNQEQYDLERHKAYGLYEAHQSQLDKWKSCLQQCIIER